jgi:hypothetical protein
MSEETRAEHYEADEALLRLEVPRVRQDLVSPVQEEARTDEPVDDPARSAGITVELTPDGARIHRDG